jgi:large subunit ribosomal protein L6|uniref:Ribosomal protein L6 n=1 Tax=Phaeodactylum tricornutum TaxID=2850 RepID=A0A6G7IW52_PHATR|nr:ribosomal protein L6 [Phaeodactylum tricornutum]
MKKLKKKYTVKVPENITLIYCEKKEILVFEGGLGKKTLKLKVKIFFLKKKRIVAITSTPFNILSTNKQKKMKFIQGTTTAAIKHLLIETSVLLYKKLKLVGVGYKAFETENRLLLLKLGYSHFIYFRVDKTLSIFCLKSTKLFVYGNCYQHVTQTASLIRAKKLPEPYKGKGVLYENEKIELKEGKKI